MEKIFRLKNQKMTYSCNTYHSIEEAKKDIEFDINHLETIQRHQEFFGHTFAIEEIIKHSYGDEKISETPFLVDGKEVVYDETKYYDKDIHFANSHKKRKLR